jgi:predicted MFS family arabinose efflux permease
VLVISNLILAGVNTPALTLLGTALWGLHMGLTEGIFSAMVADAAPTELRGTAFGVFNLLRGVLLLFASVIAGLLWDQVGPAATFVTAAVLATLSMLLLILTPRSMLAS